MGKGRAYHVSKGGVSKKVSRPRSKLVSFPKERASQSRPLTIGRISQVRRDTGSKGILYPVRAVRLHFEPKRNTTPADKRMLFWFPFGLQIFGVCVIR